MSSISPISNKLALARDHWPTAVVAIGGWFAATNRLAGPGFVTAAGIVAYGAILGIAFRVRAWRPQTKTVEAS